MLSLVKTTEQDRRECDEQDVRFIRTARLRLIDHSEHEEIVALRN
jgi:hypothetical protein